MKMEPPRPTVLIFGGTAEGRDRAGQALAGAFDPLIAPSTDFIDTLMAENFVQVVVALGPDDGTDSLTRWPETMRVVVTEGAVVPDPQMLSLPPSWSASPARIATACRTCSTPASPRQRAI